MRRLLCILFLCMHASCLTPMLWSGSLIAEPVTTLIKSHHCELDSLEAGFHLGEPVLLLEYHRVDVESVTRRVLLISNRPPSEKTSPLFLILKPGVEETLKPSEVSLRLLTHRFKGSSAPGETMASIGLRGRSVMGPAVVFLEKKDVPISLRRLSSMRISEKFEPKVQTLVDRFSNEFQLPGHPDLDDRGTWTALAWVGAGGQILEDKQVAEALSTLEGLIGERSEIYLLGRRLPRGDGGFVYVAAGLEYLVLQREIRWTGPDGSDRWSLMESFRTMPVPEGFELEMDTRRSLPSPDLDFFEKEFETTKGTLSDALVTKILLTPVTLVLDVVGIAFWALLNTDESEQDYPSYDKEVPKWLKIK